MLLGQTGSKVTLRFKPPNQVPYEVELVPYEVELVRRVTHDSGRDDDASSATGSAIAVEQVGIGMRLTNDPPFSVVSLVPGGSAALSGEIRAKNVLFEIDGLSLHDKPAADDVPVEIDSLSIHDKTAAGDVLVEIDSLSIHDKTAADVRRLMLGAAGSPITLTLSPASAPSTRVGGAAAGGGGEAEQVGIGMRLTNDPPFSVVSLVPGGAAALSGDIRAKALSDDIRAKDVMLEIDGVDLSAKNIQEVRRLMLGPPQSTIAVKLLRGGATLDLQLTRQRLQASTRAGASHS
ncbi:hypothetical protein T484DRAFT_1877904 [Baffinella frigidus]|nr:hypothetical protein T484DRAFT_1877904 [Cryptophyta sp. CCMP2293]